MDFSSDIKEQVRSQTDIVALIGEAVALTPQRGGREHVGLCCFHDDHNPSMRVYADRQSYRCWVCNAGGDCFSFVQEREKVSFPEALEILAKRAGIKLPERGFRKSDDGSRSQIYEALLWAQELFHKTFLQDASAQPARDYIASRGMSDEMIKQFRIGYHPNSWDWLLGQARGKFKPEQLLAARLIGERDSGGYHDHFVDACCSRSAMSGLKLWDSAVVSCPATRTRPSTGTARKAGLSEEQAGLRPRRRS